MVYDDARASSTWKQVLYKEENKKNVETSACLPGDQYPEQEKDHLVDG
jgi:hypothetical protein